MKRIFLFALLFCVSAFAQAQISQAQISIEGHRGTRGYLPENTIPSFIKALELGADTLELDVVISKDGKVVVSHEPWFSHVISLDQNGKSISREDEKNHNIYKLNYDQIKLYDVGSLGNEGFPEQQKLKAAKPLLSDVFKAIKKYAKQKGVKVPRFNVEIKSNKDWDGTFTPAPMEFAKLVYKVIKKEKMLAGVKVQSFDPRMLEEIHKIDEKLPVAILVSNDLGVEKNLARLTFKPESYSPHFSLVTTETLKECHSRGIKLVPWTVNENADIQRIIALAPDGIITDYPDRIAKMIRERR